MKPPVSPGEHPCKPLLTASKEHAIRQPFEQEPDTGACSVNYEVAELPARGERIL